MKRFVVFILGLVSGIVLTLIVLFAIAFLRSNDSGNNDVTYFETPGDVVTDKNLKVFQVVAEDAALAAEDQLISDLVVLVVGEQNTFYDGQVIKAPKGKHFRQIGTYRYPTRNETIKTVPVVQIME